MSTGTRIFALSAACVMIIVAFHALQTTATTNNNEYDFAHSGSASADSGTDPLHPSGAANDDSATTYWRTTLTDGGW